MEWKSSILNTILNTYVPNDTFKCIVTGLFYQMQNKPSCLRKRENWFVYKSSKKRITIML